MTRAVRLTIGGLTAGAVAIGATSTAAAAAVIKGSSGPLVATLTPSTHTPKINTLMPISVTATLNGKPAHATAAYQFLYGGAVVAPTQYPYNNKHFSFTGHFSDKLNFPASSLGFTLTLRVVIKAAGHTVNLPCSITSHK
jgi:hypothetical protein